MELALNLGKTVSELEELPAREFGLWIKYAEKHALPLRRMELYMAQVALVVSRVMGGNSEALLSDYVFDPLDDDEPEAANDADAGEVARAFAFNPRKVKG